MVRHVLRNWLAKEKVTCLPTPFKELLPTHFKLVPCLVGMISFAELAKNLIALARNGVLGPLCTRNAFEEATQRNWMFTNAMVLHSLSYFGTLGG